MSFSQLKRIFQSGQNTFFILYEVLAPGKGPTNSAHGDVLKQKNPRPPAALDAPYSVWICGYMDRLSP